MSIDALAGVVILKDSPPSHRPRANGSRHGSQVTPSNSSSPTPSPDTERQRSGEDVGPAGHEYRAAHNVAADIRARHGPSFSECGRGGEGHPSGATPGLARHERSPEVAPPPDREAG